MPSGAAVHGSHMAAVRFGAAPPGVLTGGSRLRRLAASLHADPRAPMHSAVLEEQAPGVSCHLDADVALLAWRPSARRADEECVLAQPRDVPEGASQGHHHRGASRHAQPGPGWKNRARALETTSFCRAASATGAIGPRAAGLTTILIVCITKKHFGALSGGRAWACGRPSVQILWVASMRVLVRSCPSFAR